MYFLIFDTESSSADRNGGHGFKDYDNGMEAFERAVNAASTDPAVVSVALVSSDFDIIAFFANVESPDLYEGGTIWAESNGHNWVADSFADDDCNGR